MRERYYNAVDFPSSPIISDEAQVYGNAKVIGTNSIRDKAQLFDNIEVEELIVYGSTKIHGNVRILDCTIAGEVNIEGEAKLEHLEISGDCRIK